MNLPRYPYHPSLEQRSGQPHRRPVVIVGAGPVGLTLALDLARRDVPVVVIDDNDHIGSGSRAPWPWRASCARRCKSQPVWRTTSSNDAFIPAACVCARPASTLKPRRATSAEAAPEAAPDASCAIAEQRLCIAAVHFCHVQKALPQRARKKAPYCLTSKDAILMNCLPIVAE